MPTTESHHVETSTSDEGGDPPCWAHMFEDEDEPPTMSDDDLARLMHSLADAIVVCDPDGQIVFWNEASTRIFGWTEVEALGQSLDLIIPERLRKRHWDGYERVMATGETSYGDRLLEVPALHRDGHTISIAFTVSMLLGDDGLPTAIAAVIRDDTERWQERQSMRHQLAKVRTNPQRSEARS